MFQLSPPSVAQFRFQMYTVSDGYNSKNASGWINSEEYGRCMTHTQRLHRYYQFSHIHDYSKVSPTEFTDLLPGKSIYDYRLSFVFPFKSTGYYGQYFGQV